MRPTTLPLVRTLGIWLSVCLTVSVGPACQTRKPAPGEDDGVPSNSGARLPADSGQTLDGTFDATRLPDEYSNSGQRASALYTIQLNSDGSFQRWKANAGGAAGEAGVYFIGQGQELVLYVEKTGGVQMDSAKVEKYLIKSSNDTQIILERSPGLRYRLAKRP